MTSRALLSQAALRERLRQLDHGELRSSGYWLTNFLMVISTVLGVYLAAKVGLQQAITFDEISDLKYSYNLQTALADELAENAAVLRQYNSSYLSRALPQEELLRNNPGISHFVWDTMKSSPQSLETPGYFLNEIQRFYRASQRIITARERHQYSALQASQLLTEQLDCLEHQVLPRLRNNIARLRQALEALDVQVAEEIQHAP